MGKSQDGRVSWLDSVFLQAEAEAEAKALTGAGEQHGRLGDVETVNLPQSEERAESFGKFVQTGTHPSHEFVAVKKPNTRRIAWTRQVMVGTCSFMPLSADRPPPRSSLAATRCIRF